MAIERFDPEHLKQRIEQLDAFYRAIGQFGGAITKTPTILQLIMLDIIHYEGAEDFDKAITGVKHWHSAYHSTKSAKP